jgi:1,2-diacylglycerol 3-alpha-glucosyltransferase
VRIGFFTDTYLPVANGICYVIDILREDLERAGHEVWVFAPCDVRWHLKEEAKVIRYPALGGLFYEDQFNSVFWPPKQFKKVKALNLDAIVAFTPTFIGAFGAYCARRLDIPYVIQYGTDLEAYAELYKPATMAGIVVSPILAPYLLHMNLRESLRFWRGFFKRSKGESYYVHVTRHMLMSLHARADLVIATSQKIATKISHWPLKQHIEVIPTGVDALPGDETFSKYFRKKYDLSKEDEIILYAGRMSAEKNIEMLINAFTIVAGDRPKAKLLLVGDFQHRWKLEKIASRSKYAEHIIFTGRVSRAELGEVYKAASLFAFPSLTDCQALVINEAAHAGLPIVWCDTPELNPVLADRHTGLQAKDDPADFAYKISNLLGDDKLRHTLGAQAKATSSRFSEQTQTDKFASALSQLIKAR